MTTVKERWTPKRDGEKYCSAGCGRGCTVDEFLAATEAAAGLCEEMPDGWVPRVWENMGWHFEVTSPTGHGRVHPHGDELYLGSINLDGDSGMRWYEYAPTPRDAFNAARELAMKEMSLMTNVLDLHQAMKEPPF